MKLAFQMKKTLNYVLFAYASVVFLLWLTAAATSTWILLQLSVDRWQASQLFPHLPLFEHSTGGPTADCLLLMRGAYREFHNRCILSNSECKSEKVVRGESKVCNFSAVLGVVFTGCFRLRFNVKVIVSGLPLFRISVLEWTCHCS